MKSRSVYLDNNYVNSFSELKCVHMANSEFWVSQLYCLFLLLLFFLTLQIILGRQRYAHKTPFYTCKHEDLNLVSTFMKHL